MIHVVLLHPEIPHNTGAIGRLCVGLDCPLHIIRPFGFFLDERNLQRAGLDYWKHLNLSVHDNWDGFLNTHPGCRLFFASTSGERSLYDCDFRDGGALVFGAESRGLPPPFYERYRADLFKIPMPGEHARSINLANSAAICMYEAWRQIQ
jgi:Predicted rRNA methylase (SpoU class)